MKINIQKVVKCLTVLFAVVAVTLATLSPAAHAAVTYQVYKPEDYYAGSVVDGNTKTVSFVFDGVTPVTALWLDGGMLGSYSGSPTFTMGRGSEIITRTCFFGVMNWPGKPCNGGVLDVSDIMPGAEINLEAVFNVKFHFHNAPVEDGDMPFTLQYGAYCYDADGSYLTHVYSGSETGAFDYNAGDDFTFNVYRVGEIVLPANVTYVAPFVQLVTQTANFYWSADLDLSISPQTFKMSTDINMIYEQSQTMDAIKNELGEINDQLGDLNDKQDETNDKLDDIITGGQAGDELQDATGPVDDAVNDFNNVWSDYEDASGDLPTPPDDFSSVVDEESLEDAISNAQNVFDYEASGLTYMYAPMGLSLSLAILFYVIFGKR